MGNFVNEIGSNDMDWDLIVEQNKQHGFFTTSEVGSFSQNPYCDVFWFDGKIGMVENGDFIVTICASGEMKATLILDGKEVLTSRNAELFKPYIENDAMLHELLESKDENNKLVLHEKNFIDFSIEDKRTGETLETEPYETVFEFSDVRWAFLETDMFEELYFSSGFAKSDQVSQLIGNATGRSEATDKSGLDDRETEIIK